MTKKTAFLFVLLCILALGCIYAGGAVVVQASPYALQVVNYNTGTYTSTYGFGFKAGYRQSISREILIGGDVSFDMYKYNELENRYLVIGFKGVGEYFHYFNKTIFLLCELNAGLDIRKVGDFRDAYFALGAYIGLGYRFNKRIKARFGADLGLAFQKGPETKSTDFTVKPQLGVLITV